MQRGFDLNVLRDTILRNQHTDSNLPARRDDKVFVDRYGNIVQGEDAQQNGERPLSEVHQGVFASCARLDRDAALVANRFPPDTRRMTADGVPGWLYQVHSELGDPYTLFAYHDGSLYQVQVVAPCVEGQYSPHSGHLYSDGRICFGGTTGMPTLEQAYAKSVLWATGFSIFLRTGRFPFSKNNL